MQIDLVRLTEVPTARVAALLNEPRLTRHMPLAARFDEAQTAAWVAAKDAQWASHGYGPWAVVLDGRFAGWGGFQREQGGADLALVLAPEFWGSGAAVVSVMLERGFGELGLDEVLIALPPTRHPARVVARFGFVPDGEVEHGGARFRQFRLRGDAWSGLRPEKPVPPSP